MLSHIADACGNLWNDVDAAADVADDVVVHDVVAVVVVVDDVEEGVHLTVFQHCRLLLDC